MIHINPVILSWDCVSERQDYRIFMIHKIVFVLFCGNCSPASTHACSNCTRQDHSISPSQSFSLSNFAGFRAKLGPFTRSNQSWHDRCHDGDTRSIAVIGRKRSAQDSWDDACASSHFGKDLFYPKRRLEIDLIFNPKEKPNAEEVFTGRDRC